MRAQVSWQQELRFSAETENGHCIEMDGNQGASAPSPMEMVLMAAGGCSSVDVVSILKKARQKVVDVKVAIEGERIDAVPAVFRAIHLHFTIVGTDISEKHAERAVNLSAEKYCSVAIMLAASVDITHSFEVVLPS